MSILIKGMEMPTDDMKNIMILADGRVFQFSGYGNPKPLGTAVPVPPHGRLIDGDVAEVISYTSEDEGGDFADGILYAADRISKQPTVIEAEEGET